ncbi:hypothetical protein PghCCS26_47910 [Paenibacillus glycanilyticus]|uniref:Uncharacterized protein n=1 Tax=Paenibacillus glycanilyticus TaxID=126569 RepID=A0ABQ6NRC3_9BACL|nr:hypothetical protein [Paenibacillus glycanilyticus]GMK47661.1 hypothetical protein PghCCS26_47910 [Paenibacillus glycanilyticus]
MKLLIEYEIATGKLMGAVPNGIAFVDLPETCGSITVEDEDLSAQIWESHVNGGAVTIVLDEDGAFLSADIETVTPPAPPKTPEELRIEQLEADNLTLMEAIADLYEMIIAGGAA